MTDSLNVISTKPDHLDDLAAQVRNEHRLAQNACANALAHGMNAGDVLIEAKSKLAKCDWGTWLKTCQVATSTARLYQQLARHRSEIEAAIQGGAELSLRGARRFISKPSIKSSTPKKAETLVEHWHRVSHDARTAFLDAVGVDSIPKAVSAEFARDLCSRIPARQGEKTNPSSNPRRPTLALTKITDAEGRCGDV
jgi:hypothetical protein